MKKKRQKKRSRMWLRVALAAGIVIIAVALAINIYNFIYGPIEVRTLDARFTVSDKLGFDVNTSALTFGIAFPGNSVSRSVFINNDEKFPVIVKIFSTDDVAPYLSVKNETVIMPGENKEIGFVLQIPKNMSFGDYSGKVIFKIYKYTGEEDE